MKKLAGLPHFHADCMKLWHRHTLLACPLNLEIFFLQYLYNLEKKKLEKKSRDYGGHLAKFFCEVNLKISLEIFVSQDLLFVIYSSKSRDFLY
jgi:hypothetical protein